MGTNQSQRHMALCAVVRSIVLGWTLDYCECQLQYDYRYICFQQIELNCASFLG